MNILKNPQMNLNPNGANLLTGGSADQIAGKIQLGPEALSLLEQKSELNGVNFEQVLAATEKGQDPEAVIQLLKNEKNTPITKQDIGKQSQQLPAQMLQNKEQPQVAQVLSGKNQLPVKEKNDLTAVLSKRETKPKSIFVDPKQPRKQVQANLAKQIKSERKSIFDIPGRKKVVTPQMAQVNKQSMMAQKTMPQSRVVTNESMIPQNNVLPMPNAQKAAVTPQNHSQNLVSLNQFMANQSPTQKNMVKQQLVKNAYKPISKSMFNKKVTESLPGAIRKPQAEMTLQDVMFQGQTEKNFEQNMGQGQNLQALTQTSELQGASREMVPQKVFQLSEVESVNSYNELLGKVQNYIIQTREGQRSEVQMAFHHQELGQVDLIVNKMDKNINVAINTHQAAGQDFFLQNQSELVRTLQNSGVQLGEFKIEIPNNLAQNNTSSSDSGSKSNQQQDFNNFQQNRGQHNSESGQREHESRRRDELWQIFQDKEVA